MKATLTRINTRIEVKERKQEGILSYDIDNNYPNRIRDIVHSSGMGRSCVSIYNSFIFGGGFQDATFARRVINRKGLTPDKLLRKTSRDYAYFRGYYIHVNYNALYEISEINYQPFTHVRKTLHNSKDHPNMYAVYKDWGGRVKKEEIVYINKFNPDPRIIQREVDAAGGWDNYSGQLYYYSDSDEEYSTALYDAVLEDMQSDHQAKVAKYRNLTTDFMASHILKISKIEGEETGTELQDIKDEVAEFQGADERSKVMVVEVEGPDQVFEFVKVDQQDGDRKFEYTESSLRDNIRQAFLIPPALLMQLSGKLAPTADEVIDATKSYNSITEYERLAVEESFKTIFQYYTDKSVNTSGNYAIVPKKAVAKDDAAKKKDIQALLSNTTFTIEQKISMLVTMYEMDAADAEKLVKPSDAGNSNRTLAEKLQVGGTQSLISVLTNTDLTAEQKRGTLKVLFSLSDEQILELVPNVANTDPAARL